MSNVMAMETVNVGKTFGDFTAVSGVSFSLECGAAAGIIGPNGAGKSTFFNLLTGMYPPSTGKIMYMGQDITNTTSHQRVRTGIVRSFQLVSVFDSLNVLDNMVLANARLVGGYDTPLQFMTRDKRSAALTDRCMAALERVGIESSAYRPTSDLSYGDKRRLEIGMSLSLDPKILLLDEPFAGLSDYEIAEITELLAVVKQRLTFVIIEHKISRITRLVDRLTVLHEGSVIAEGECEAVLCDDRVQEVYWGKGGKSLVP